MMMLSGLNYHDVGDDIDHDDIGIDDGDDDDHDDIGIDDSDNDGDNDVDDIIIIRWNGSHTVGSSTSWSAMHSANQVYAGIC